MYDMDLCNGIKCPLKDKCLRYTHGLKAIENNRSFSWWVEPAYNEGNCYNFIEIIKWNN